jgi:hypothetical protein
MLSDQRIPMNEQEAEAVKRLLAKESSPVGSELASLVRTEPGETGPIRVEIGDQAWLVDDGGHYRKVEG